MAGQVNATWDAEATHRAPGRERARNSKQHDFLASEFLARFELDGNAAGCRGLSLGGPWDVPRWMKSSHQHHILHLRLSDQREPQGM